MPDDPQSRTPNAAPPADRIATAADPNWRRRLRLGPELGFGGGPELGLALFLVMMLAVGAGAAREAQAIWPFDGSFRAPFDALFDREPVSKRAAGLLAEAIRIETANPPGNERALALRYANELRRSGVETRLIETPSELGAPPRAAVWARLPSAAPDARRKPALALLSHLDTVPANPEEWSVAPFAGEIWDGFVWGRGALDAKGVGVTHLLAMVAIAEAGIELDRDLVFLATPDEETGGQLGAGWLVETHPELFEGVGTLLTEGGGIQLQRERDVDRPPIWGVALTEKAPCWLELRASGRAGHSSSPTPDAAVPRLVAALDRIRRTEAPIRVVPEVAQMFTALAPVAAEWDRPGFLYLASTLENDEGFRQRFLGNPGQNALVRNTISITVLEGAAKTNVAPKVARAQLDARLLPGERCDTFASGLRQVIDDDSITVEELLSFPAIASPMDTPLFRAIAHVAAEQDKPGLVVPRMIGGFTDAHWFRKLGIVAYGFVPRALTADESRRVHGIDERVAVETLTESVRLTIEIVKALDAEER